LSIFENPKILCSKKIGKKNKLEKGLKDPENHLFKYFRIYILFFNLKKKNENKNNTLHAITILR